MRFIDETQSTNLVTKKLIERLLITKQFYLTMMEKITVLYYSQQNIADLLFKNILEVSFGNVQ